MRKNERGSMTLEACLVLPLFLCIVWSILFLIKVTYTHEMIQHAINETAWEIASTAYIYQASGLRGLHDATRSKLEEKTGAWKENVDGLVDTLKSLGGDTVLPVDQIQAVAELVAGGAFGSMKTELMTPLTRLVMEKYLTEGSGVSADARLKTLNIKGGLAGLDFSRSGFFADEEENIEIVVSYEVDLPLPLDILPDLKLVQRAEAKAWMSGDEPPEEESEEVGDDLWSLGNLERGSKIRSIFGANLPFSFPVIAKFEGGTAVMIKSMDMTAESYQDPANIKKKLEEYLDGLEQYNGQEIPWGSKKIVIHAEDIHSRQLLLVIPKNELSQVSQAILDEYVAIARRKGIDLKIERYGYKSEVPEDGGEVSDKTEEKAMESSGEAQ